MASYPGRGWVAFREYGGEVATLAQIIGDYARSLRLADDYTMVDIGSGDGTLLCELAGQNHLEKRPETVLVIEPDASLCEVARESCRTHLGPLGIRFETYPQRLGEFTCPPHVVPGVVLAIHTSYYFTTDDVSALIRLRQRGFAGIMLESDEGSWVTQVFSRLANERYPLFEEGRFERIVDALGGMPQQIRQLSKPIDLREPSLEDAARMVGFFAQDWKDRPSDDELAPQILAAIREVRRLGPKVSYQSYVWPSDAQL